MSTLRSIVLCGGSGTRLWPLSRALVSQAVHGSGRAYPVRRYGGSGGGSAGQRDPLVVCNEEHRFYVAAALQQKGVSGTILLEPKGRNTAPAIALAAFAALSGGGDPLLLVLPSDHVLKPQDVFAEAVARAAPAPSPGVSLHSASRRMHRKQGSGISAGVGRCPRAGMLWRALWKNRISPEPRPCWRTEGICGTAACSCSAHPSTLKSWPCTLPAFMRRAGRRGKGITPIGTLSVPTPTPS